MFKTKKSKKAKKTKTATKSSTGQKTVKDFKKGDYICINNNNKKQYIRGDYDRSEKKFHLIDTKDVWGNGRYVKGSTIASEAPPSFDY